MTNYENYNLVYIANILKIKSSLNRIFKLKSIGELYTGISEDVNSKSEFDSIFELPDLVLSGKIIINSLNN